MDKRSFEQPEVGVFYLVPDPKTMKYTIYSDMGEHALHLLLWDKIQKILEMRFKEDVGDVYRGIPRGRIQEKPTGTSTKRWIVGHGNDFPLKDYKEEIIKDFNLRDAEVAGLIDWEFTEHETMINREKKIVEKALGIKMDKNGFKKVVQKKSK